MPIIKLKTLTLCGITLASMLLACRASPSVSPVSSDLRDFVLLVTSDRLRLLARDRMHVNPMLPDPVRQIITWRGDIILLSRPKEGGDGHAFLSLGSLEKNQPSRLLQLIESLNGQITTVVEDNKGQLWVLLLHNEKYQLIFFPPDSETFQSFPLPPSEEISVLSVLIPHKEGLIFMNAKKVSQYREGQWKTMSWQPNSFRGGKGFDRIIIYHQGKLFRAYKNYDLDSRLNTLEIIDLDTATSNPIPQITQVPQEKGFHTWNVTGMIVVNDNLWLASWDSGIFRWEDDRFKQILSKEEIGDFIKAIDVDNEGTIWIRGVAGSYYYDGQMLHKFVEYPNPLPKRFQFPSALSIRKIDRDTVIVGGFIGRDFLNYRLNYIGSYSQFNRSEEKWKMQCPDSISQTENKTPQHSVPIDNEKCWKSVNYEPRENKTRAN
ncbi:MAG: hypothetical protein AAGA60_22780 [Cyanobacteria bacterium P01_E01_bin.42]